MPDAAKVKKSPLQTPPPAPTPTSPRPWLMLSAGAILGAIIAITAVDAYFSSTITDLVTALGFIGPAAPFLPLGMIGILAAIFSTELAALILVWKIESGHLLFLWNLILSTSAIAGAGLALLLAATIPAVFDFALMATHNAFPAVMPWVFIAGFGFVGSTFLAYLGYRGGMAMRERRGA